MRKRLISIVLIIAIGISLTACIDNKNYNGIEGKTGNSVNSEEEIIFEKEEESEKTNNPEDIQKILNYTGMPVENYDESIIRDNNKDLNYYISIVRSLYDMPYWKAVGTAEVAFGIEPSKTEAEVISFIDGGSQRGFESMFAPFFWEDYNEPETIEYAKSLAYYLTEYAVDRYSYPEFLSGNFREEWLKMEGSTSAYVHDEYNLILENAKYDIEDSVHTINVDGIKWICQKASWINDAGSIYDIVYDSQRDFDAIKAEIIADAPEWYEAHKFPSDIWIEFYDDENVDDLVASYTNISRNDHVKIIFVDRKTLIAHEYVHALTSRATGTDLRWLQEGVANYYSDKYRLYYCSDTSVFAEFLEIFTNPVDESIYREAYENERAQYIIDYINEMKKVYDDLKAKYPSNYHDGYYANISEATVEISRDEESPLFDYAVSEVYEFSEINLLGQSAYTELEKRISYEGATVLVGMLIKEYGADTVLEYLHTGGNFKRRFGMTSEEFYQNVREEGIDYSVFFE